MPDEIDPEDRDKLVDLKFGELFDKHWERKFGEEFDKRVTEMTKSRRSAPASSSHSTESEPAQPRQQGGRKLSLLDKALGFG